MLECLKKKQAYSDQKVASEEPFINIVTVILIKKEPRQVLRMNENAARFKLSDNANNNNINYVLKLKNNISFDLLGGIFIKVFNEPSRA